MALGCYGISALANSPSSDDFSSLQCYASNEKNYTYNYDLETLLKKTQLRQKEHYVFSLEEIPKNALIIDVTSSDDFVAGTLKLPVHSLKLKKYLRNQNIILLGNGKNYASIEKELNSIRAFLSSSVKIFYGGVNLWRFQRGEPVRLTINEILPAEFVTESKSGKWIYIENKKDLEFTLNMLKHIDTFDRFAIIDDELFIPSHKISPKASSAIFRLKGGKKTLKDYMAEQGIIIAAKKQKELHDQCSQTL
ncbi:hypothetical protein JQC92_02650 [Shewanella sp. 202IG2-18]|uniref:hypothetical protein n=1 Tax=Parashewanella hymeniacidonis TaxID=2807618 RepID=UPI001960229E|nr:hypothetical protein [Parashewanella hymeniacidonis]MBM7070942.1 hypothetical protein [Parashewanella hymeniacidonis]